MLIKGSQLTDAQRRIVLAAFVHRHTIENATRRGVACVMCADSGGNYHMPHNDHVKVQTDDQWLADHSFAFTKDGSRLSENYNHAEPAWLADLYQGKN